jgi:3-carboxy-cis,cis-muconate cycloisomerase
MILLASGALKHAINVTKNLQVDEEKMRENIARENDVILAEAAVFALTRAMSRTQAEECVKRAVAMALAQHRPLIGVVREITASKIPEGSLDWEALGRPENYLGAAGKLIDTVLEQAKRTWP